MAENLFIAKNSWFNPGAYPPDGFIRATFTSSGSYFLKHSGDIELRS